MEEAEVLDEFALYQAMAYNHGRRGSRSLPSSPLLSPPFIINRTSSVTEKRRSTKKRMRKNLNNSGDGYADYVSSTTSASANADIAKRLARITLSELANRRLRTRRHRIWEETSDNESDSEDKGNGRYGRDYQANVEDQQDAGDTRQMNYPDNHMRDAPGYYPPEVSAAGAGEATHRSSSFREQPRGSAHRVLDLRPRTLSMPSKGHLKRPTITVKEHPEDSDEDTSAKKPDEFYLLRTFSTSKKGIVNRGDSFKKRSTRLGPDNTIDASPVSLKDSRHVPVTCEYSSKEPPLYRVLLVGGAGVGKSSLLKQFTSSDYRANLHRDSISDSEDEQRETKTISVVVDNNESALFIATVRSLRSELPMTDPDAYVIMYSVSDADSFQDASNALEYLKLNSFNLSQLSRDEHGKKVFKRNMADGANERPLILVGNKSDIVRNRRITEKDGKELATEYSCKFTELSAIMNMKVDELLVGIVQQIRLKERPQSTYAFGKTRKIRNQSENSGSGGCFELGGARGLVSRFLKRGTQYSRSCDNLMTA